MTASRGRGGERADRPPRAGRVKLAAGAATRARNDRWLAVQRFLGCSDAQLAAFVGRPYPTVAAALREARARAEADEQRPALTADDLAYLRRMYGPDAEESDDPDVREWRARFGELPAVRAFLAGEPPPPGC